MEYSFNITIVGTGKNVDEAFENALDALGAKPNEAILGEVGYVRENKVKNSKIAEA